MGLIKLFKEFREYRATNGINALNNLNLLVNRCEMTKEKVMKISAVRGCVEMIANTVASIPIKLYKENEDKVEEIKT